jgi:hypothetical protein
MKPRDSSDQREPEPTSEVSLKILRYLEQNPNAADTLDGILEWWLPRQSIYEQEKTVQLALDSLVERKLLLTKQSTDMRKHYRLNTDCIQEIRRIISDPREASGK